MLLHVGTSRKAISALRAFEVHFQILRDAIRTVRGFIEESRNKEVGIAHLTLDRGGSLSFLVVENSSSCAIGRKVDMVGYPERQLMQVERIGRHTSLHDHRSLFINPIPLQVGKIGRGKAAEVG